MFEGTPDTGGSVRCAEQTAVRVWTAADMAEDHAARVKAEFERLHQRSAAAVRLLPHSPADLQLRMERLAEELRTPMPKIVHKAMRKTAPPASEPSRSSRGGRGSSHGRAGHGGRARATRGRGGRAKTAAAAAQSGSDGSDTDESDDERLQPPEARRAGSASRVSLAPSSINTERCASCGDTLERRAIGGCCSVDCWRKMRQHSPKALPAVTPKACRPSSHSFAQTFNGHKRKKTESASSTVGNTDSARSRRDAKSRRLLTATEEAASPKPAKRPMLGTVRDASASRLQPATVKSKWLDLPLGLLQWGFTEQLHCRQHRGQWTVSAGSPNVTSPVCVSGPAAHRWLCTAATQGAMTQVGAVERRIAAAAKVDRDEFHGPLPFLPRTVRRRLRLMSVTSPQQARIAQRSKAQRHADRLAAAEIREANALRRDRSMPGTAPKIRRAHACSSPPVSASSTANPTAQQHRPELQPQQKQQQAEEVQQTVLLPNTLQKSNQDRNQAVSAIRARHDADTRPHRAAYHDNARDRSNDTLVEEPPPRSALWQRTTSLSTSLRPVEAYSQQPSRMLGSSTTGAQSWLDNRRPQLVAPAAAAVEAASASASASSSAAAAAAPFGLQASHLAAIDRQTYCIPSVSTVSVEQAPGENTLRNPVASIAEESAESSFDFGDTLDGGLQLSTGGLGLTSLVALIAPRTAGAAGAAGNGWDALANPHRTSTSHATDASGDDGSLAHVLPAPRTEY